MATHRNIIDFDPNRRPPRAELPFALPQLVVSAQRTAKHHLKKLLPEFFSKVDDSLFAMAEKAGNNQLQATYFDAMREARLQKDALIEAYHQHLESLFNQSLGKGPVSNPASAATSSLDHLGLMGDEELEESLAFTSMAEHADGLYREGLFGLTARLNFLIEEMEINKENNPLRPAVFCEAFGRAIGRFEADIKVRLVIYKLFDKQVAQQLGPMYDTINADLIAAGVLPRIKHTIQKSPDTGLVGYMRPDAVAGEIQAQGVDTSVGYPADPAQPQGVFESLQHMLSVQRTGGYAGMAGGTGVGAMGGAVGGPIGTGIAGGAPAGMSGAAGGTATLYFAPQDILGALSNLQANADLPHYQDHSQPSANFIKASLSAEIGRLHADSGNKRIEQSDTDTIDIVSMLFDFILDDPALSDHIKALIARLQIPLLKVAILDKAFFAKKSHPARQLLNELAYAGSDAVDEENPEENATYKMVAYVVDRVLMEFEDDTTLFDSLLGEFTRFVEEEREANRLAEEMLAQSKERVAAEIQKRVQNNTAPFIRALLVDAWKDVLTHIFLRDGDKGAAWDTALQVADDLIWSVQPKLVVSERQRLVKVIPRVLNGLRDGLTLIAYDRDVTARIFEELEKLHLASLRGGVSEIARTPTPAPRAETQIEPRQTELQIEGLEEDFVSEDEFYAMASHNDDAAAPAGNLGDVSIEEIVLASEQALDWDGWNELESNYFHEVKDMALGTWVEFIKPETYQHVRGKLAWKCDFTGDFTFVDRKYKVVADLTFKELLRDFDAGRAFFVEDVPLFDRALDSVIKGFKNALSTRG
jgi:hypothetical protein